MYTHNLKGLAINKHYLIINVWYEYIWILCISGKGTEKGIQRYEETGICINEVDFESVYIKFSKSLAQSNPVKLPGSIQNNENHFTQKHPEQLWKCRKICIWYYHQWL